MKIFFLNKNNFIGLLIAFFGAFFLFPGFYDMTVGAINPQNYLYDSLDPSWAITLNYANIHNLTWGKDFAFTYGPLSYLAIRIGWGVSKWQFLVFDLFCFINLFLFFFISYKKSVNKIFSIAAIVSVTLILPTYLGGAMALLLFLTLIFYIRQTIEKQRWIYYTFSMVLLVLIYFIKFNTALISFFPYYGMLIYLAIAKKEKIWVLLTVAILPIIVILLMSHLLHLEIYGYIISGMEMVKGYNEIMYLENIVSRQQYLFCYFFIIVAIGCIFYKMYRTKETLLKSAFILGLFMTALFVLYKQAFVRADVQHVMEFFKYTAVLLVCFSIDFFGERPFSFVSFSMESLKDSTVFLIRFSKGFLKYKDKFIMSVLVAVLIGIPFYSYCVNTENNIFDLKAKLDRKNYINGYKAFTPTSGFLLFPNNNQLPQPIIDKIGNQTVDVYPWNIHLLLENKLNYLPRPVIQSYTAYTPYLEELNFNHYNSAKAPKFVLYDYAGTDYRYPLFDETKMNLVLLKRYKIADSFIHNGRHILLLEKNGNSNPVKLHFIREYAITTDSPIIPQEGIYYEVEVYNTLQGRLYSLFDHAPAIDLGIKTEDNTIQDFKTSKPLLQTGLFSNRLILKTKDFENVMLDSVNRKTIIKQYNFKPKRASLFKDKIRIKEYKIE